MSSVASNLQSSIGFEDTGIHYTEYRTQQARIRVAKMGGGSDGKLNDLPQNGGQIILHVAVGSGNPCKINSVKDALTRVMQQTAGNHNHEVILQVEGFDVESGVAAQPMGDEETKLGAQNRAVAAYHGYRKKFQKIPHLAVGLEGGLEWSSDEKFLFCMAWMCCYGKRNHLVVDLLASSDSTSYHGDKKPIFGFAKTASFPMPTPITKFVKEGLELGDADDKVFNRVNSKQGSGTVGILSNGLIDRSAYYEHAIILALVPWIRPDVYPHGCDSQTQVNGAIPN